VSRLDELPGFVARIRHGRPPPPGLIEDLTHRYQAIGGSPLLRVTADQARALSVHSGLPVLLGMRLWEPSVEDALREAARQGLSRLVFIPLAPFSVDVYGAAARRSLERELDAQVHLDLKVRVRRNWRRDEDMLDRLGIE